MEAHFILLCLGPTYKLLAILTWYLHRKYDRGWIETAKLVLSFGVIFWTTATAATLIATLIFALENSASKDLSTTSFIFAILLLMMSSAIIIYPGICAAEKRFEKT
jgi:hypothetical protein